MTEVQKTVNDVTDAKELEEMIGAPANESAPVQRIQPGVLNPNIERPPARDRSKCKVSINEAKRIAHDPERRKSVQPTSKQKTMLLDAGYSLETIAQLTLDSASAEIDYAIQSGLMPMTPNQKSALIKWGFTEDQIADWDSGMASEFFEDSRKKANQRTNGNYDRKRKAS